MARCPFCFRETEARRACIECLAKKRWHIPVASALDYTGPVRTLVKNLKYGQMPYLAKTAASFLLLQLEQMGWESPDLIVPVPRRVWLQGSNHATVLAKELAKLLQTDVSSCVGRHLGDLSQARLVRMQRERVGAARFYLKKRASLREKSVLIVDDVATTGTTLRHTSEIVKEGCPKKIYALTLAQTL
ncbi:MAG: hypothetical protein S4CHLAM2_08700 [Chlamydiales bacterium]|nr:hypothetical protein [Chlamydiales bacterium]